MTVAMAVVRVDMEIQKEKRAMVDGAVVEAEMARAAANRVVASLAAAEARVGWAMQEAAVRAVGAVLVVAPVGAAATPVGAAVRVVPAAPKAVAVETVAGVGLREGAARAAATADTESR